MDKEEVLETVPVVKWSVTEDDSDVLLEDTVGEVVDVSVVDGGVVVGIGPSETIEMLNPLYVLESSDENTT